MTQLEHWGCPWSRKDDGHVNVRFFGGMKVQRTWFAADKTGFHMLHTLFQTSHKYPSIKRYDEYFCADLIVEDGRVQGVVAIDIATGEFLLIECKAAIICTGGAGRVFGQNTNAGIVTGDGMGIAYRHGVPLRDMEFVQYHPTALPGSGVLITEGCRGEGGILTNKDGYRYLQDYGLGPPDPWPRPKAMELGPRDRLSQAFWHEEQKGRTASTPLGQVVLLDLRHLGAAKIHERLPLITEVAKTFMGVDPVVAPIPVRPAVHYTMGGIPLQRPYRNAAEGPLRRGRMLERGHPRRQPPRLQLAVGNRRVRQGCRRARRAIRQGGAAPAAPVRQPQAGGGRRAARCSACSAGTRAIASPRYATRCTDAMDTGVGIYRKADTHAGGLRQARQAARPLPAAASSSTTATARSTPSGCRRSSSASPSRSPR